MNCAQHCRLFLVLSSPVVPLVEVASDDFLLGLAQRVPALLSCLQAYIRLSYGGLAVNVCAAFIFLDIAGEAFHQLQGHTIERLGIGTRPPRLVAKPPVRVASLRILHDTRNVFDTPTDIFLAWINIASQASRFFVVVVLPLFWAALPSTYLDTLFTIWAWGLSLASTAPTWGCTHTSFERTLLLSPVRGATGRRYGISIISCRLSFARPVFPYLFYSCAFCSHYHLIWSIEELQS
ncbi:hypothetical protein DFH07DRAFT_837007 [Mycena maculata]|uniref:Uncharacterized protein n=1 Tax=Mycena maculata TaxID=230809 RepID=A0AAD7IHU2_9AGAR|nr:hypothetical protein DFH07DRAFT_837007 [Mycena maculata]